MAEPRDDGRQETLFDALAPPRALRPAPPLHGGEDASRDEATVSYLRPREGKPQADELPAARPADEAPDPAHAQGAAPVVGLRVSREDTQAMDLTGSQGEAAVAVEHEIAGERAPRVAGAPLAGPTLDDVMSRVWEGLVTGLPAACPVCHDEVTPVLGGPAGACCTSCGTLID